MKAPSATVPAAEKVRVSDPLPPSIESELPRAEGTMVMPSLPARLVKLVLAVMPEASKVSLLAVPAAATVPVPLMA